MVERRVLGLFSSLAGLSALTTIASCKGGPLGEPPTTIDTPQSLAQGERGRETVDAGGITEPVAYDFGRVARLDFNRSAARLFLPLFWREDANADRRLQPSELAVLFGFGSFFDVDASKDHFVREGAFTDAFRVAYDRIAATAPQASAGEPRKSASPGACHPVSEIDDGGQKERDRKRLVLAELDQGRPTLIATSFAYASGEDKRLVAAIVATAELIDRLFARQNGVADLPARIPAEDPESRMLFFRNQSPWCVAPATESNPACGALPDLPARTSGLYPRGLQADRRFCEKLAKRPNADELFHQFTTVAEEKGRLVAVPYNVAFESEAKAIRARLEEAASAAGDDEPALRRYLEAAAKAFLDNGWEAADEAWAAMNASNSKWYLRIGPDEVYFEPCSRKAGFHLSFARINQASLAWQEKLDPTKNDMEAALAAAAGKPYRARKVDFHLPDFIDIILNAGDSRDPQGATIGQSLPNWGPVANEGRGRTVAMVNLYTDTDSIAAAKAQAESLLCPSAMETYTTDPTPQILSTVLHEAAHNLGPAHEYKVRGKTASQIFGGPLASTLEELKAQTAALFFIDWLERRGLVEAQESLRAYTRDVVWAFGHIAQGMYTHEGKPKNYSQLAAIQLGFLRERGALEWRPDEAAANGVDRGCMAIDFAKLRPGVDALMSTVASIKARGDKRSAQGLIARFVNAKGEHKALLDVIRERWLRAPKATFVYSIEL